MLREYLLPDIGQTEGVRALTNKPTHPTIKRLKQRYPGKTMVVLMKFLLDHNLIGNVKRLTGNIFHLLQFVNSLKAIETAFITDSIFLFMYYSMVNQRCMSVRTTKIARNSFFIETNVTALQHQMPCPTYRIFVTLVRICHEL